MQRRRRGLFRFIPLSHMQKNEQSTGEQDATDATTLNILHARAAAVQPVGYGVTDSNDLETLVAEQDAVQRTLARLSEPLRLCLVLSIIGQFSSGEIARMLNVDEAAVRQRLTRARKQFQQFYRLEGGEEVYDQRLSSSARQHVQTGPENQQKHTERVESRNEKKQSPVLGRDHAERFYRNPAATPLW
jgi:RNA polymerase sigma factor (sigma-70 family)